MPLVGAIVPWNYPFHNVFNPVSAALFSGNAIVIKVSEYASWSIGYYKKVIDACLDAVGAPRDLVQFVVGYGATGSALVTSGICGPTGVADMDSYCPMSAYYYYYRCRQSNLRRLSQRRCHSCQDCVCKPDPCGAGARRQRPVHRLR